MNSFKSTLSNALDHFQPSGTTVLLSTAIAVGAGTGLGAVFFIKLITAIEDLFFTGGESMLGFLGRWLFVLVPLVGGLLAGPIISFFAKEAKGHGVPEVMQALVLSGGRIRPRVVVAKIIASALCIGSGGSAGREGPIVQVGAALGSVVGQKLKLSEARIRNLVACGSAAGVAATFNAPIAGVVFAIEIILGEWQLQDLGSVVISAVTASTLARIFLGERPAFSIPEYGIKTPWEVLLYALLGVFAALGAVYFIRLLYWFEDRFDGWRFPDALKPGVGGLLLGLLAFIYPILLSKGFVPANEARLGLPLAANIPHIFGAGFSVIGAALSGQLPFVLLLILIFLKPLATSLTLGSGNSGGVFAPALFTGAVLGGAFGRIVELIAPGTTAGPGAFAVVGMAAVFAGAARAPFTAILIVFEMTNDYRMIIPLMTGVIISTIVAERIHRESIYTLKLARRGIQLKHGRAEDVMETVSVEEVMVLEPVTVPSNLPVMLLPGEFLRTGRHGFPVLNEDGSLLGIVSLEDYRRVVSEGKTSVDQLTVGEIATRDVVVIFPDETVGTAMRYMAPRDISRIPVVSRDDPKRLVGVVRRNDIVRAYDVGVVRREEARRRAEITPSVNDAHAEFIDMHLLPDSTAVGKTIAELNLPRSAVFVSIRRGSHLIIPHGDIRLQAGDLVTALSERENVESIKHLLIDANHSDTT